jgi:hypothetical protein
VELVNLGCHLHGKLFRNTTNPPDFSYVGYCHAGHCRPSIPGHRCCMAVEVRAARFVVVGLSKALEIGPVHGQPARDNFPVSACKALESTCYWE